MVWRIHFGAEDLAKTRIGMPLGPLAETQLALSLLRCPDQRPAGFASWRRRAPSLRTASMRPLEVMIPRGSRGVDLYTVTGSAPTIERGVEALLAMPGPALHAEIEYTDRQSRLPGSVWSAAEEGSPARSQLVMAAVETYGKLVQPYWANICGYLHAERAARGRVLMEGGVRQLLATLQPGFIRWRPPVLEVLFSSDFNVYLGGRGLVLVPSLFVGDIPVFLFADETDATSVSQLVFPALADPAARTRLWVSDRRVASPLIALVGRTRAAVLRGIVDGCTTTELARRAGVSAAAASQHATVLRDAGLVTTRRHGSAVLHSLTPLGADLLSEGGLANGPLAE
jgi:DNA-binding transcriptional ArsR family regulator